ncbi:MAG: XTP/dITP diphosphatase [Crenarchaeota archaeon]|nr:XTP/dITP diphosphatase [Thermoproteota archaeon]
MVTVYFLSSNPHKLKEVRSILAEFGIEVVPLKGKKVEIQSSDLREIISYAAEVAAEEHEVRPIILEDSGFFVHALGGFPGPYSRYVYDTIGVGGVLKLMEGVEDRRAHFECAAACVCPDNTIEVEVGKVYGKVAEEPRGDKGFGFDPIFIPEGYDKTFAELGDDVKKKISHRALALRKLAEKVIARVRYPG